MSRAGPGDTAEALLAHARRLARDNQLAEAIAAYARLLERWPALPNAWYNLAVLQRKSRRFSDALESYQQALERGIARPEEVHLNRGVIYADHLRQEDAAERELLAALALNAAYVPALLNLANLHEDRGRREPAAEAYLRALAIDPNCSLALARYANLRSFADRNDALLDRLRRASAAPNASAADRADLGFALGRALDAVGDYSAAFTAYAAANVASRESASGKVRYDRAAFERLVDRVISAFPSAVESMAMSEVTRGAAVPRAVVPGAVAPGTVKPGAVAPRPIFICGMFRSGSTLMEQILAGHSRITAGGELDLLPLAVQQRLAPFPESMASASSLGLEALAAQYRNSLHELFPAAEFVTDKRPDNFLYIGLIKRLFPDAKIVHTQRDPLDNCLSVFFLHLDHRMSYALDLMDTGHYYGQYRRLMAHWKALYGADIIDVQYDALVHEPKSVMANLLVSLGLEWEDECLDVPAAGRVVKTASVWQVREPLHTRSSGRAAHYPQQLAALRSYLQGS